VRDPVPEQVVRAELAGQHQLGVGEDLRQAVALEDAGEDCPAAAALEVEEGVADRDRHLPAQLGAALGVAVDEHGGLLHAADPTAAAREEALRPPLPTRRTWRSGMRALLSTCRAGARS
jgi:hypothetical protein